ncbi:MAG: TRAP transporter substrate-binding protein DctP, partial [Acidobacteriota bacterium]
MTWKPSWRAWPVALALLASILAPAPARAEGLVIKLATLVPEGSSWYDIIREMGEAWKQAAGGKLTVRVYAGGVAGDDADVVRKMRLGTLNASVLTTAGLAAIDRMIYALEVPMMYASYEELDAVLA